MSLAHRDSGRSLEPNGGVLGSPPATSLWVKKREMTDEDCLTCDRMVQLHQDCVASIQKLKQLARAARAACDNCLVENLLETVRMMESESADLLRALEVHRENDHGMGS
jgi:hypothetical protein